MTSSSTRGVGAASTSSTTATAASDEENRKLNFDLEILSWRVSRFVEKLNAQLHFDWIVLGHAESVSIRRRGLETFIDEGEEEEEDVVEDEDEEDDADREKDPTPLKMHCEDDTISEIPMKKRKMVLGEVPRGASIGSDSTEFEDNVVVKQSDSASVKNPATSRNSVLLSSTPPLPESQVVDSSSSSSADEKSNRQTSPKCNANEKSKTRGSGRGRGASSSSSSSSAAKCTKHKSINYGKSSSSVTIVANAAPVIPKTTPNISNNTIIDLTDISATASSPSTNVQNAAVVSPALINSPSTNLSPSNPPPVPQPPPPPPAPELPRRKPFQCSFCPFSTERSLNLQNHQLTHADFLPQNKNAVGGVVGAPVSGSIGGTVDNSSAESVGDRASPDEEDSDDDVQTEEPTGLLSCTECEYTTMQISQLNRHMLLHSDVRPYTCDKCDFACNTSLNLDIHMQSHAGGDPTKSNDLEQLLDSNLGSAPAKQNFSINDFDLSFLTAPGAAAAAAGINGPSAANSAVNSGSNGVNVATSPSSSNGSSEENPYRCGRCSYSSKNLNDLKQHFGSHVGEGLKAPLKCTKCNFSCTESSQLREHFQAVHAKKTAEIC